MISDIPPELPKNEKEMILELQSIHQPSVFLALLAI